MQGNGPKLEFGTGGFKPTYIRPMERVDLVHEFGKLPLRRWAHGGQQSYRSTTVSIGRLADGRWYAERHGSQADVDDRQQGACVFADDDRGEVLAGRLAERWMDGDGWRPVPAQFGPDAKPSDGLAWVRRGADWFLDEA